MELPTARHTFYVDWIEHSILEPLRAANTSLIERAVEIIVNILKEIGDEHIHYGTSLLQAIPKSLYQIICDSDPQLAQRFGHEMQEVVYFGDGPQFVIQDLFTSVKDGLLEAHNVIKLEDVDKREMSITIDKGSNQIVMEWTNGDSQSVKTSITTACNSFPQAGYPSKYASQSDKRIWSYSPGFWFIALSSREARVKLR